MTTLDPTPPRAEAAPPEVEAGEAAVVAPPEVEAGETGTVLPRWVAEPPAGPVERAVPVPDDLPADLATCATAALVRVLATLAAESTVLVGRRDGDGPVRPLRVDLPDGSWRDLLAAVQRAGGPAGHAAAGPAAYMTGGSAAHAVGGSPADRAGGPAGHAAAGPAAHRAGGPGARFDIGVGDVPDAALTLSTVDGVLRLRADPAAVDDGYADRLTGYLSRALAALAADPDRPHATVDLLRADERRHLVHGLSGPSRALPEARAHELFATRAAERPDAVALLHRGESWTYRRLDEAANQVAHALLAAGLAAEEAVAVAATRGPRWAAALLGVLKAGGVYLPVEPDHPAARIAAVLARSRCRLVLTDPGGLPRLAEVRGAQPLPVDEVLAAGHAVTAPDVEVGPHRAAYIYFTSGSTGEPKGALCEHLGMVNHLMAKVDGLGLGPQDIVVQNAQATFDISLWQLLAPLVVGGRSVIVPAEDVLDVGRFLDTVLGAGASVLQVVPSYLDVLLRHLEERPRDLGRLRWLSVTGEAVGMPLVRRWLVRYPGVPLVNAYGATEASDDTTHEILRSAPPGDLVPVGRPVGNVTVYVLGPGGTLQPLGGIGEIAFSGVCVGRGYVNDPERTAAAFGADPFRPGERTYRTGDVGRWLPTGSLEFRGRRDEQVKVNGVRLELGEVESRLLEHPRVRAASVVVTPLPGVGTSLVGFYTSADGLDAAELRDALARVLPASAVPARLRRLDALPLTGNGKVDKRALARTARELSGPEAAARVAPGTPTERRIAEAWAAALGRPVDEIGVHDHFFDVGGGSLSALRAVARLGGLISLKDLLRTPVLAELAAAADDGGTR